MAEAARSDADPDFAAAVDTELADFWLATLDHAREREGEEELGWLVLRAARSAAPYLLRQHRWDDLGIAAEKLLVRDPQHRHRGGAAAACSPTAAEATRGTDLELRLGRTHARALVRLRPRRGPKPCSASSWTPRSTGNSSTSPRTSPLT